MTRTLTIALALCCCAVASDDPCPDNHVPEIVIADAVQRLEACAGPLDVSDWDFCVAMPVGDGGAQIECRDARPYPCAGQTWGFERRVRVAPTLRALEHEILHAGSTRLLYDVEHVQPEWARCGL